MIYKEGILIVLSGPSGAGKGTVCKSLFKNIDIQYSVSTTTRSPRPGEIDGRDYFFIKKEDFEKMLKEDGFLEWAKVYDNYYGTPKQFVENMLAEGKDCILEIDPQGAKKVKEQKPDCVLIFIAPPSMGELEKRITNRGTENQSEINKRLSCAKEEMLCMQNYDYLVINDQVEKAVEKIKAILIAEKCSIKRNKSCCLSD